MAKINWPKWALLAWAIAVWLTWCGNWKSSSPEQSINHAPELENVPTTLSMLEETWKIIDGIICSDPDGDPIKMTISSSNSNLIPSYDESTNKLDLNATAWNLADWVNKEVDVALTCSDGDKNTTKTIEVTVQDQVNDRLLTYTTNIPTQVSYNGDLNWTISLNDPNGSLSQTSYTFYLLDDNNNSVYTWTIDDINNDWNYSFWVDLSTLNLSEGNYTFQTEPITPVVLGENPQKDEVISQGIDLINKSPVAIDGTVPWNWSNPYTFSMNDFISDAESLDSDLQIQIVTEPSADDWTVCWTATVNWQDVTINLDSWKAGTFYIEYKVIDPEWKESDVKKITINDIDNA